MRLRNQQMSRKCYNRSKSILYIYITKISHITGSQYLFSLELKLNFGIKLQITFMVCSYAIISLIVENYM